MNLAEIQTAVRAGRRVCWMNPRYTVVLSHGRRTGAEMWHIVCDGGSASSLTRADGVTMNEKPGDFFIDGLQGIEVSESSFAEFEACKGLS